MALKVSPNIFKRSEFKVTEKQSVTYIHHRNNVIKIFYIYKKKEPKENRMLQNVMVMCLKMGQFLVFLYTVSSMYYMLNLYLLSISF